MQPTQQRLLLFLLVPLIFLLLTLGIHSAFQNNTPGIDFYVYWQAGRAFFLEGIDPYGAEVSTRIQYGIYHGREALPGEDPMKFNYPPFVLLLTLPFSLLPFDWAQAAWMAFNLLAAIIAAYLSFPDAPKWLVLLLPFFYQFVFGWVLGNLTVPIFVILLWLVSRAELARQPSTGVQVIMGVLLAWVSAKPQLVWLYVILLLLVSLKQKNYIVLISYAVSLGVLSGLMFLVRPDWLSGWLKHVFVFQQFHPSAPCREFFLNLLFPPRLLQVASWGLQGISVVLFGAAFALWLRKKLSWVGLLSWCSLTVMVVHPACISYDQLVLLLPVFLWGTQTETRPRSYAWGWVCGLSINWIFLLIGTRFSLPWVVNQMPIVLYLAWMLWLHIRGAVRFDLAQTTDHSQQ